jgi:hypothetical protein
VADFGAFTLADANTPLLEDPVFWAILGVVVAVVVPVAVYLVGRTRKALAYEVSATPLVVPELHGDFEISYHGQAVRNAHLVEVVIGNTGNAPIRTADYERPLLVDLGGQTAVLAARVTTSQPSDLEVALVEGKGRVGIAPLLLNAGDTLPFRF